MTEDPMEELARLYCASEKGKTDPDCACFNGVVPNEIKDSGRVSGITYATTIPSAYDPKCLKLDKYIPTFDPILKIPKPELKIAHDALRNCASIYDKEQGKLLNPYGVCSEVTPKYLLGVEDWQCGDCDGKGSIEVKCEEGKICNPMTKMRAIEACLNMYPECKTAPTPITPTKKVEEGGMSWWLWVIIGVSVIVFVALVWFGWKKRAIIKEKISGVFKKKKGAPQGVSQGETQPLIEKVAPPTLN